MVFCTAWMGQLGNTTMVLRSGISTGGFIGSADRPKLNRAVDENGISTANGIEPTDPRLKSRSEEAAFDAN
ncbi:hypothetical protein RZS28_01775 [Methylocapsa polymorpha]|uniref:Uncharacterized protein n=1 Tax=Methylocapsa polymorpha TaxID=3080828 RepID=A0ABZ0HTP4_9HYPH|nr:hypothetical protein RZS28_01775 [Methylocapsa sp. RX1]